VKLPRKGEEEGGRRETIRKAASQVETPRGKQGTDLGKLTWSREREGCGIKKGPSEKGAREGVKYGKAINERKGLAVKKERKVLTGRVGKNEFIQIVSLRGRRITRQSKSNGTRDMPSYRTSCLEKRKELLLGRY